MGYVLPVDRYQYTDYQVRGVEDTREEMKINRAFKVVLERHHQEVASNYNRLHPDTSSTKRVHRNEEEMKERIYGELTGKGQLLSEKA